MRNKMTRIVRHSLAFGLLSGALAFVQPASAGTQVGFSLSFALPPGVMVSVGNYEPYYVGRVFYEPLGAWRPVYSFPVRTPYGMVYEPYIYDGGRVVCQHYIPGPELGYGAFIVEGRGYFNPRWHRGRHYTYAPYYPRGPHAWCGHGHGPGYGHDHRPDHGWKHGRKGNAGGPYGHNSRHGR